MPDGISVTEIGGKTYLLTANEGDSRADWAGLDNEYENVSLYEPEETYEYLKENSVTSDTQLFEFLLDNYDNQNKLFTKNSKMKENYYIKEYIANVLPRIKKLSIFKGINGYMFETINDGYEIYVGNYSITLKGYTKEEVLELVRTIKIDEKK